VQKGSKLIRMLDQRGTVAKVQVGQNQDRFDRSQAHAISPILLTEQ
jgi:hypothetical protein